MQATSAVAVSSGRRWVCSALAVYALAGGAVSFLGWALDIPRLTDWFNAGISIQPNSTVLLMAAGVALILLQLRRHRVVLWLGAFIALIGALSLLQHVVGADFGFNHQLTFGREWGDLATVTRGRVGPPGSTSFTLIGVALLLLAYCEEQPQRANLRRYVPLLGLAVSVITLFSLVGYALGAEKFYALPSLSAIALQTATLLLALGIALVASVPERQPMQLLLSGSPAGTLARRILPALILLPPLLAWLKTEAAALGFFDDGTGRSLLIVAIVLLTVGSMWWALSLLARQEKAQQDTAQSVVDTVESINDGFVRLDPQWRFVYINRQAERLAGLERGTTLGRTWHEAFPAAPGTDQAFQRAHREQTPVELESCYEARQRWYSIKAHPMRDGGLALLFQDITDRKRGEAALERQALRLQLLGEAAGVLLNADAPDAMLQRLFTKIALPLQLEVYFNFTVDGDSLRLASYSGIAPETAAALTTLAYGQGVCGRVALQRQAITVQDIQHSDDPAVEPERSMGVQAYTCNPLMAGETLLGTLSFGRRSKTAFGADDLEFLQTICHYAAAAFERIGLIQRLRDAARRKDEFLALLAHELRNPLAPVRNAVKILGLKGTAAPELLCARDVIDRQVQHMSRLIDDLLDVSRISQGKFGLKREHVELTNIVQRTVETWRPLIEQHGHELIVDVPPQPVYVDADATRLFQVLCNLLDNATKYSERGGRIVLTAGRRGRDAVVTVRDFGIGLAPDVLPKVFDMFAQAKVSSDKSRGGLGLGLTLVKQIVELHEGRVEASSEGPGKGSEFSFRLPLLEAPSMARPSARGRGGPVPTFSRRIVVVDDNRDAADSLAMNAAAHGQRCPNRVRRSGGRTPGGGVPTRRRASGHRSARDERIRHGPCHPERSAREEHAAGRCDRMGTGGRSPAVERSRLRPPHG